MQFEGSLCRKVRLIAQNMVFLYMYFTKSNWALDGCLVYLCHKSALDLVLCQCNCSLGLLIFSLWCPMVHISRSIYTMYGCFLRCETFDHTKNRINLVNNRIGIRLNLGLAYGISELGSRIEPSLILKNTYKNGTILNNQHYCPV